MNSAQVVLPLILGLVVISWQRVHADEALALKGKNSGKPGNRTGFEVDHDFYVTFACRGKTNGLHLPIAGSCVDYYKCQDGVAKRLTCKSGMHFSSLALTCLDAHLSKCKQEESAANCKGRCCGREDGLYPAKGRCSGFLVCLNGVTLERNCGGNLQFSAADKVCDVPERARCSEVATGPREEVLDTEGTFVKPIMYTISHRVCRNRAEGSALSISGSCNKFYLCINKVGYLKSCGHMQFNPQKGFCDARTRKYCPLIEQDDVILDEDEYVEEDVRPHQSGKKPTPANQGQQEDMLESGRKPASEEGRQPIRGNKQYPRPPVPDIFKDEERNPFGGKKPTIPKPPVPADFEYEPEKPIGNNKLFAPRPFTPDSDAAPQQVVTPDEEDKLSAAYLAICANQPVGARMAMPDNCSKFIRCRWDWFERRAAEVVNCPSNMHFNAKSKECDWPANAGCIAFANERLTVNKKKNKYTAAF